MKFRTARQQRIRRYRRYLAIAMLICIPVGIGTKFYSGILETWVQDSAGGMIYVMFGMFLLGFIFPELAAGAIAIIVFLLTSLIEFSQLSQHPILEAIRTTFIGRLLIGTTFDLWDFLHYGIGCMIGWFLLLHHLRPLGFPALRYRLYDRLVPPASVATESPHPKVLSSFLTLVFSRFFSCNGKSSPQSLIIVFNPRF
ncbi:DUF2809 domain-containing protein [Sodalinema gerasimenkoae]|uniref:ribosomal maturation YjgA family protein n=1 Tax=Sodalinema gerasimenkoae TaxID=2862348 RepID=UPI0013579F3E|nr:DUF2809 domain-containing protein [Sodalinema gerasimenkoae]